MRRVGTCTEFPNGVIPVVRAGRRIRLGERASSCDLGGGCGVARAVDPAGVGNAQPRAKTITRGRRQTRAKANQLLPARTAAKHAVQHASRIRSAYAQIARGANQPTDPVARSTGCDSAVNIRSRISVDDARIYGRGPFRFFCPFGIADQTAGSRRSAFAALHIPSAMRVDDQCAFLRRANQTANMNIARTTDDIAAAGLAARKAGGDHPAGLQAHQRADCDIAVSQIASRGDEVICQADIADGRAVSRAKQADVVKRIVDGGEIVERHPVAV